MGVGSQVPRRVSRVQLGVLLQQWRQRAGIAPATVLKALEWHQSKLSKLENGAVTISAAEVDRLIELYGVPEDAAPRIRALGSEARKRGLRANVPDWAQTYVDLEQGADEIKLYDGELILGVLQTDAYANALLATSVLTKPEEAGALAAERALRRERITSPNPPQLWVVLGEAALYRQVGGPSVLREQLIHLTELADLPNVTLQVLPFASGEHAALGTSFHLLEFHDPTLTFVYLEGLTDADYLDTPAHTDAYRLAFNKVLVAAANERESRRMLTRRVSDLPS